MALPLTGHPIVSYRECGYEGDRSHALYTLQAGEGNFIEIYSFEKGDMSWSNGLNLQAYLTLRDQCRHYFPTTLALSDRKLLLILTYVALRYAEHLSLIVFSVTRDALWTRCHQTRWIVSYHVLVINPW